MDYLAVIVSMVLETNTALVRGGQLRCRGSVSHVYIFIISGNFYSAALRDDQYI